MRKDENKIRPFIKWAGGKGQLLDVLRSKYPADLGKKINRYCEPFVGGGAVLMDILSNYNLEEILVNDINAELINTYVKIRDDVLNLTQLLLNIQNDFIPLETEVRKEYFYEKRTRFNELITNKNSDSSLEKAALFIFLNKTCFNGLYRVNSKGLYNVPIGAYKNPLICDKENLQNISVALKNVKLTTGSYKTTRDFIDENTFVYIDPPYRPLTHSSSFTAYSESIFDDNSQLELGEFVHLISGVGAKVVVSNSDPKSINSNDLFFDNLYGRYNISRVVAKRMINCDSKSRGNINELLISTY